MARRTHSWGIKSEAEHVGSCLSPLAWPTPSPTSLSDPIHAWDRPSLPLPLPLIPPPPPPYGALDLNDSLPAGQNAAISPTSTAATASWGEQGWFQRPQQPTERDANAMLGHQPSSPFRHDAAAAAVNPTFELATESAPWPERLNSLPATPGDPYFIIAGSPAVVRPHAPFTGYRDPTNSIAEESYTSQPAYDASGFMNGPARTSSVTSRADAPSAVEDMQTITATFSAMAYHIHPHSPAAWTRPAGPISVPTVPNASPTMTLEKPPARPTACPPQCSHASCDKTGLQEPLIVASKRQSQDSRVHVCQVVGCNRREGFSTKNDLARHQKTAHRIYLQGDRSFQCAFPDCAKGHKIWPRFDNFKAHCTRMHGGLGDEAFEALLKDSVVRLPATKRPDVCDDSSTPKQHAQRDGLHCSRSQSIRASQTPAFFDVSHFRASDLRNHDAPVQSNVGASQKQFIAADTLEAGKPPDPTILPAGSERPVAESTPAPTASNLASNAERLAGATMPARGRNQKKSESRSGVQLKPSNPAVALADKAGSNSSTRRSGPQFTTRKRVLPEDEARAESSKSSAFQCSVCSKRMDRQCNLEKHRKHHLKPWGCTHDACFKTFSNEDDWKRHENSKHYQLETFRCNEQAEHSLIKVCAELYYRPDDFQAHLRMDHNIYDDHYIRNACRRSRCGRNFQRFFWCGFCRSIIELKSRGLEAWDERFEHIDRKHFQRGERVESWYPPGKDRPKGRIRDEADPERARHSSVKGGSSDDDSSF